MSAARQTGAGKPSTAAPQNGQNEPHYHPKGASATCGWHDGAGDLGFRAKGKLKTEIPAKTLDDMLRAIAASIEKEPHLRSSK